MALMVMAMASLMMGMVMAMVTMIPTYEAQVFLMAGWYVNLR